MSTVFTMPGKMGDAILQWPVVAAWVKKTGKTCTIWADRQTCKPLVNLFKNQNGVEDVVLMDGVESYHCGGQPFHMNIPTEMFEGKTVYHLGMREFPQRQISAQSLLDSRVPVEREDLPGKSLQFDYSEKQNRLILHGQSFYGNSSTVPSVWKFINSIKDELAANFKEIVFVGTPADLEVSKRTYPEWETFDDGGDVEKTAKLMDASRAFIGCGSSMAALAGAVGIPAVRVHDPIGNFPKNIWSNLGEAQLNATHVELRKEWEPWSRKFLYNQTWDD